MAAESVQAQVAEVVPERQPMKRTSTKATHEWMARVGTALALARFRKGLSRDGLAKKAKVNFEVLKEIESGDGACSPSNMKAIKALCSAIDSTPEALYELSLSLSGSSDSVPESGTRRREPRNGYAKKARKIPSDVI